MIGKHLNGYERVATALKLQQPDRIPLMELAIHPKVIKGLCPTCDLFDLVRQIDLDGVVVACPHIPEHATSLEKFFVNMWGVRFARTAERYAPIEGPIKSMSDLEKYRPPDPHDETLISSLKKAVQLFKGEKFICYQSPADFFAAQCLRGFSELLIDFVINPELAHGVLRVVSDYYCTLARRAIEAGADALVFGDDWAFNVSPLMSPQHFREFVLPYFKKAVHTVKKAGGYVIKHSDGNLWPLMDMIVESGIDAIHPIQPDARMDIGEVKQRYGKTVCVAGNINCGYTLSQAPVEEVVGEVKEAIRKAGPGGGYIMTSSNSLHSGVKPENYLAMVKTTQTYGKYPLNMQVLS